MKSRRPRTPALRSRDYDVMLDSVVGLIEEARCASARTVNAFMTATYWLIGRHIVEFEQKGKTRAEYGEELVKRLAEDLSNRCGRGFSKRNIEQMRLFYLGWPIAQTLSAQSLDKQLEEKSSSKTQTVSAQLAAPQFHLPWSVYVRLLSVKNEQALISRPQK